MFMQTTARCIVRQLPYKTWLDRQSLPRVYAWRSPAPAPVSSTTTRSSSRPNFWLGTSEFASIARNMRLSSCGATCWSVTNQNLGLEHTSHRALAIAGLGVPHSGYRTPRQLRAWSIAMLCFTPHVASCSSCYTESSSRTSSLIVPCSCGRIVQRSALQPGRVDACKPSRHTTFVRLLSLCPQ